MQTELTRQTSGRRGLRNEIEANYKFVEVVTGSPLLELPMGSRRERRAAKHMTFRPVYGYRGTPLLTTNRAVCDQLIRESF